MFLSQFVRVLEDDDIKYHLKDDKEFDYFARISTSVEGKKCVFVNELKYLKSLDQSVSMVITTFEIVKELPDDVFYGVMCVDKPRDVYFRLLDFYEATKEIQTFKTEIGSGCKISKNSFISDHNVKIGNNVIIEDYVWIDGNVEIGDNTVVQSGCKIGAQLLNTYHYKGEHIQSRHNGQIIIGKNALLGCNTVVAQALYDYGVTVVGDNAKVETNVSIGHNDIIGNDVKICAGVVLGGYVLVGSSTFIGLGASVKNATSIGCNASVGMGSVVVTDVKDGSNVFGNPARKM